MEGNRRDSLDEREKQTLDNLEISDKRADAWRSWTWWAIAAIIAAIGLSVLFILWHDVRPALTALKESSQATSQGWAKIVTGEEAPVLRAVEKLDRAMASVETMTANGALATGEMTRLIGNAADAVPRATNSIERVAGAGRRAIEKTSNDAATLLTDTNRSLNAKGGLLPSLTASVVAFADLEKHAASVITAMERHFGRTFDDLHAILGSPEWALARAEVLQILKNVNIATSRAALSTANLETMTSQIAEASTRFPAIAEALQKIANTSSKYGKALWLARIFAVLAGGWAALGF
jgi:hypothetical protein